MLTMCVIVEEITILLTMSTRPDRLEQFETIIREEGWGEGGGAWHESIYIHPPC